MIRIRVATDGVVQNVKFVVDNLNVLDSDSLKTIKF